MSLRFRAKCSPGAGQLAALAKITPKTPFNSPAYAEACALVGQKPCLLTLEDVDGFKNGCLGVIQGSRWSRYLEIITAPNPVDPELFWNGVYDFARAQVSWELSVLTFGSEPTRIPTLPGELNRRTRYEYLIHLDVPELFSSMPTNHRRNIRRARKAELVVQRTSAPQAIQDHNQLMSSSIQRRIDRGENVSLPKRSKFAEALLQTGAAELFQVSDGNRLLSSILVIRSQTSAYYHSAGTAPDGMKLGAAHFLIAEVSHRLRNDGLILFNLGGADPGADGLRRFKSGFGAEEVELEAATFSLASPLKRKLRNAAQTLRNDPSEFFRSLKAALLETERYRAYTIEPGHIPSDENPAPSMSLRRLNDPEIVQLSDTDDFRKQAERFHRLGYNAAYGLYNNSSLVHVAWLIDASQDHMNPVRNVRLRPGEAEITHCITPEQYRGCGYYPIAIRMLCQQAAKQGIKRIYMITGDTNLASQKGIEKAGMTPCGSILRAFLPAAPQRFQLTWRGHRWSSKS